MKPKHKNLGPIACQPAASKLKLRKRMPGWLPDEIDHKTLGSPNEDENDPDPGNRDPEVVFPEEALLGKKKSFHVFQPEFNGDIDKAKAWVLGLPFQNYGNPFDKRLATLLELIQEYNVRLYDLRWHHLSEDGNSPLPKEITGHENDPKDAEKNWSKAVKKLTQFLENGDGRNMILDVVEVNKYIVSVRVVETDPGMNPMTAKKVMEIGGSSSSHLFIPFKG